ncbi:hypothetical protein FRB97_009146 [Tulasnella sp. 331]|nr:hypothetical protein FRB97_009146 [Tulasnella sp. 331]KAG8873426.1 hypothetical protein FRB98_009020 [Tulasnella sp. 332]
MKADDVPEFTLPTLPESGEIKLRFGKSRKAALREMKKDVYYVQDFISKNIVDEEERDRFYREQIKTASGHSWIRDLLGSSGHAKTAKLYEELTQLKEDLQTLGTRRVLAEAKLRKEAAKDEGKLASGTEHPVSHPVSHPVPHPVPQLAAPQMVPDWSFIDPGSECNKPMEPDGYLNDADIDIIIRRLSRAS